MLCCAISLRSQAARAAYAFQIDALLRYQLAQPSCARLCLRATKSKNLTTTLFYVVKLKTSRNTCLLKSKILKAYW
jgi:hypothetical protein